MQKQPLKNRFFQAMALLALAALAACATPPPPVVVPAVDPTATLLDQSLRGSISTGPRAAPVGADVKPPPPIVGQCSAASASTPTQCVTLSYYGDASVLLKTVAEKMGDGWTFEVTGPEPRLPIYVQSAAIDVPVHPYLESVAHQLAQRADIVIRGKRIELRYRAARF